MPRLLPIFLEEMGEHVRTLNQGVLALEKGAGGEARAQHFRELFRAAHSLKGAARSANVILIEGACHRLEGVLTAARDGRIPLDAGLFALLFAATDALEEAGQRLREQSDLGDSPLSALLPRLDAAVLQPAAPARATPTRSASEGPPEPAVPARDTVPLAGAAGSSGPSLAATVRIPAARLDSLLTRSGELLVARRRVETRAADLAALREFVERWKGEWQRVEKSFADLLPGEGTDSAPCLPRRAALVLRRAGDNLRRLDKELDRLATAAIGDGRLLKQVAGPLNEEVHRARMLPFAEACEGLDRMVRDLAHAIGKEVELVLEGGAVELDRAVLEGLKDPLRHLVRNAVDHGAETPAQRQAAGKPPQARVRVVAALRGARVEVVVEDDGHGLDLGALRRQARLRGLPEPADDREAVNLVFLPGLSTAPRITDVSGRGVGLDVVKSRLEALHGTVDVAPLTPTPLPSGQRGRGEGGGTRFTLTVPLTLTTLRAVLVTAAGQTFAFVGSSVERLVRIGPEERKTVAGRPVLARGGPPLPLASLAAVLCRGCDSRGTPPAAGAKVPAVIVTSGDRRVVFTVDELQAEQEIVVQGLGARVRRLRHVSGATLLASGHVALVLNAASVVRTALGSPAGPLPTAEPASPATPPRKRLLVVDDSVTTRTLEKSILESAGYEVLTAIDGQGAWDILQREGADLVVSDVEMPRMDGFELTRAVRDSKRFRDLPVVLVTSRESEQDKARGLEAGADAYVLKSGFDQRNLLKTIAQLL
jgi:two-component system chemotaxis sensor kinase CheA